MTKSHNPAREDVDLPTLGRALWRALSMMRPLYTSEARILIQNDELAFTRPAEDTNHVATAGAGRAGSAEPGAGADLTRSALDVVKALDLPNNPEFAKDEGVGLFRRILNAIGLRPSPKSEEEKAANTFADNLEVFQLAKSSVISIEYISGTRHSPPRSRTSSPTSMSSGSARRSSSRPRMRPRGSATRSRCCARRSPSWRPPPSNSARVKAFMRAATMSPSMRSSFRRSTASSFSLRRSALKPKRARGSSRR